MSDLDCNEFVELVTAYLDGVLDTEAERRVVDHLAECTGCGRYLDQFKETIRALGDLPTGPPTPEARASLLDAFRRSPD